MLVTEILARNHDVGDFFRYVSDFLNVLNRSTICWISHQYLRLVTNTFGLRHPSPTSMWPMEFSEMFQNFWEPFQNFVSLENIFMGVLKYKYSRNAFCAIKTNRYLIGTTRPGQIMNICCLTQGYTECPDRPVPCSFSIVAQMLNGPSNGPSVDPLSEYIEKCR